MGQYHHEFDIICSVVRQHVRGGPVYRPVRRSLIADVKAELSRLRIIRELSAGRNSK